MNAKKVTINDVDNSINELYNKMVNNKPYILFFFRMPWLSFASHLNPSPYFVLFSSFVPYLITNPNKFLSSESLAIFDSIQSCPTA